MSLNIQWLRDKKINERFFPKTHAKAVVVDDTHTLYDVIGDFKDSVKTVNNQEPDENGNVEVKGDSTDVKIQGASIVANNVANIPIIDRDTFTTWGLVKLLTQGYGSGITVNDQGYLSIIEAPKWAIDYRYSLLHGVINPNNLNYALQKGLGDGKILASNPMSAEEQANAQQWLGIEKEWTHLIHSVDEEGRYSFAETNLNNVTEIIVVATELVSLYGSNVPFQLFINDVLVANEVITSGKTSGASDTPLWNYSRIKFNGLFWDMVKASGTSSMNLNSLASFMTSVPVFDVGKANKIELRCSSARYIKRGTIDVYVR